MLFKNIQCEYNASQRIANKFDIRILFDLLIGHASMVSVLWSYTHTHCGKDPYCGELQAFNNWASSRENLFSGFPTK